jgi:hypothetical protein
MTAASPPETAMFLPDGDHFVPTMAAQGPWDPTTAHGGPVAGLLAREIERTPQDDPRRVARLTIDMMRPVPLQPLRVTHEVVRAGRQIQVVDASLWWGEKLVARATGLRVHVGHDIRTRADRRHAAVQPAIPGPDEAELDGIGLPEEIHFEPPGLFRALELRRVVGHQGSGVPAVAWGRLTLPLVDGEATSPLAGLACLGDFTSGLANYADYRRYLSPNADLSYHLVRHPTGDWLGLDANTVIGDDGIAQSRARLFDQSGYLGLSATTLVVAPRPDVAPPDADAAGP